MANDKEIIKKLFAIVQKQQKIIVKMAQAIPDKMDPTNPYDDVVDEDDANQKLILSYAVAAAGNLNLGIDNQVRVGILQRGDKKKSPPTNTLFKVYATNLGNKQEAFKNNFYRTIVANNKQDLSDKINFELS